MSREWIKELQATLGTHVVLKRQSGHQHWGFIVGYEYRIVELPSFGGDKYYGFEGMFKREGARQVAIHSPAANYGWEFESVISVEENE